MLMPTRKSKKLKVNILSLDFKVVVKYDVNPIM